MDQQAFQNLSKKVNPSKYTDYRSYLKKVYLLVKGSLESYSYIKFTEQLGLGHCNALYLIINKGRPLTLKAAKKMAPRLGLSGKEKKYFLKLVEYQGSKDSGLRQKVFGEMLAIKSGILSTHLSKERLEFFSEWYHGAIYELLAFPEVEDDAKWLGKQLKPNISPKKIEESLSLLESLGLVAYNDELGRLYPTGEHISTGAEIRGIVFKTYHNQMMELGQRALSSEAGARRDMSSVTIGVSVDKMSEIKALTAKFRKELLALADAPDNNKEQILQVNIQVFPLTEVQKKK